MTAYLAPQFDTQFFDGSTVAAGYKLYTYESGTTTPKAVYSDQAGTVPHTNPLVLDANGRVAGQMFLGSGEYTFTLKTSGDVLVKTWNDVGGALTTVDDALIRSDLASTSDASKGAGMVGFIQPGSGAVARTLNDKVKERVSVKDFGVVGDGSDEYTKIQTAWAYALSAGVDLYFPAGTYSSGVNNMPFKNPEFPATSLLDCGNITIYGDGPTTILRSDSVDGADVLNLYAVKNLHFKNLQLQAAISGASAGSNGISIVNGWDNLTFDFIWGLNLPYVDKASYLDGGKFFTIQPGVTTNECGTVTGRNLFAKGCVYGTGLEVDLVNWSGKKHAIDLQIVAENCYQGIVFSAGAASGAITAGASMGFRVTGTLINCQRNVLASRAHGVDIEAGIVTTKTAANKRLNPSSGTWNSIDATVDGLYVVYAKNSRLTVYGDLGGCDYKAQIGATTAGSSGLTGATDDCQIYIDLGGTAATADINAVNSGGNIASNSVLYVSSTTTSAAIPSGLYTPSYNNTITKGPSQRVMDMTVGGTLGFASSDGVTSYATIRQVSNEITMQQTAASSGSAKVLRMLNHSGALQFAVRNDGSLVSQGRGVATAVSTVKGVLPIYDNADVLIGYVPIYTSYTP